MDWENLGDWLRGSSSGDLNIIHNRRRLGNQIPVRPHGVQVHYYGGFNQPFGIYNSVPSNRTTRQIWNVCTESIVGFLDYYAVFHELHFEPETETLVGLRKISSWRRPKLAAADSVQRGIM